MKELPIPLLLLCLAAFIFSCQDQKPADSETTEPGAISEVSAEEVESSSPRTTDTISLKTFNTWKTNWERNQASWIDNNTLDGFNLPLIDLGNVLGESPDSSRFYLGLASDGSGGFNAKLMVVGVKAGKDMIDYANGHYVYDVSTACPPFCGGN
jgi:hypothetical protein